VSYLARCPTPFGFRGHIKTALFLILFQAHEIEPELCLLLAYTRSHSKTHDAGLR
jgi:hypothetical protein